MFFTGILGHEAIKERLLAESLRESLIGSFVFSGPKGVGKSLIAGNLAKYSTCVGVRDDTCSCVNCLRYPASEDVLVIDPDTASIKISDMEGIEDFLESPSRGGGPKVVLINDADKMTTSAATSLLKVLEREDPYWLMILVTSSPEKMLPTVMSRSQEVFFGSLKREDTLSILKKSNISGANYDTLAGASPYLAKSLLSNPDIYSRSLDRALKVSKSFITQKESYVQALVAKCVEEDGDEGALALMECLLIVFNDILKIRLSSSREVLNRNKFEILEELSEKYDDMTLLSMENLFKNELADSRDGLSSPARYGITFAVSVAYQLVKSVEAKKGDKYAGSRNS